MQFSLTNSKIYRKLLSALFTWILLLFVYLYVIIESTTGEFLFFLTIAGYVSFIGIFGFGVMTSIFIDVITKKIKGGTKYIVKLLFFMISGVIGSVILSNSHDPYSSWLIRMRSGCVKGFRRFFATTRFARHTLSTVFIILRKRGSHAQ
ncbi:hypothetical protein ADL26_17600 [Thermoactinomyces vulgaris]|jgi:TctA family transporter|nr:hypothetical protein ADL26_17600 [Thermoactinomyces vulgaris]